MEDTVLQNVMIGSLGKTGNPWKFIKPVIKINELRECRIALERVGLTNDLHSKAGTLSHGRKRQLKWLLP